MSEPSTLLLARVTQTVVQRVSEDEPPNWEQRVQIRLMELDVDPGNDAERGVSEKRGD